MNLCINCEHYRPPMSALSVEGYALCHHPRFVSMVTGKVEEHNCKVQRESSLKDYCGPEAKFFEAANAGQILSEIVDLIDQEIE